ncbi:hypothetical protein [Serratia fonticola]|uniref:hypothetical protein n=1 Tax=Serratia fonticola TaxID=47917 RepID=UPI00301DCE98
MKKTNQKNIHNQELRKNLMDSARMTLGILLTLYIIELLRDPIQHKIALDNLKNKNELHWDKLFYRHFSLLYQERTTIKLKEYSLSDDYISNIINDFDNNIFTYDKIILNDVLNSLELDIKDELKNEFSIDLGLSDDKSLVYSGVIDFLLKYHDVMIEVLTCIESTNSKNKESMLYMTMSSFARTLASYVDDCTKPLIREIIKLSNITFIKLLKTNKNVDEELDKYIKTISRQGMGDVPLLLNKNLNFSSKKSPKIYNNHRMATAKFNKFVQSRNRITHNFSPSEDDFNYVIKNWNPCLYFFSDILTEYTQNDGFDNFFSSLYDEAKQCVQDENLMIKRVLPLIKTYI